MRRDPAEDPRWRLVTVDIDGTLTRVHGWRAIADAFGGRAAYDLSNRRFFAHEIGEDEHLSDMLETVEGRTLAEVEAVLESTPKIDGIAAGIDDLHGRGTRVALLSHNPTYVVQWYQRAFGFDDLEGSPGQPVVDGIVQAPHGLRADKLAGLRALTERCGVPLARVVHVGDGWADAALFPHVGGGVALNSRLPDVERAADLVLHTNDFRQVVAALDSLAPRT